jgi:membrane fusion protein (multidrug efflux system)
VLVKINDADLQAELRRAQYQEDLARSDENRKRQLLEARGISQEEYEIAQNRLNTAKAEVELIRAQIGKTEITAPFSGRIGLRNISKGAYVSPAVAVTTLQQTNPVKIEFSVPQKYINRVGPGSFIEFSDEKGERYRAPVYATDARIDEGMRTIRVRARHDNPGNKLVPGMFVKVNIPMTSADETLIVPAEALIPVMGGEKVFVTRNGRAFSVRVTSGLRTESFVEIRQGLKPGDTVLTTGILVLRDSARVRIENMEKP